MDNKKLGFGLMRLPSLDPNDPAKIDIEKQSKWLIYFWKGDLLTLIQLGCTVVLQVRMLLKKH